MPQAPDKQIDNILAEIEFPGENAADIRLHLEQRQLPQAIMQQLEDAAVRFRRIIFWIVFAVINLIMLCTSGTSHYVVHELLAYDNTLATFFFLFLGLSLLGSLVGLVLNLDTTRLPEPHFNRLLPAFSQGFAKIRAFWQQRNG